MKRNHINELTGRIAQLNRLDGRALFISSADGVKDLGIIVIIQKLDAFNAAVF